MEQANDTEKYSCCSDLMNRRLHVILGIYLVATLKHKGNKLREARQ